METIQTKLIAHIREHCQRVGWYGGALDGLPSFRVSPDHPQRERFAYPPAREEQLQATEAALGFPLPPFLRQLYAELANGGFGPGAGMQGTLGGYGSRADEPASTIVDDYRFHCQVGYANEGHDNSVRLIDLADYAQHWKPTESGQKMLLLPCQVWPTQLVPLEDLGCCQQICLECKTGHIFCTAPSADDALYELLAVTDSLESYLEYWLRGALLPSTSDTEGNVEEVGE